MWALVILLGAFPALWIGAQAAMLFVAFGSALVLATDTFRELPVR
jgi:hypothetical protein